MRLLIVGGMVGYHWIEGFSYLDSLYVTVTTLTTVGYGDFVPHTPAGKVFTVFLILGGVFTLFYAATAAIRRPARPGSRPRRKLLERLELEPQKLHEPIAGDRLLEHRERSVVAAELRLDLLSPLSPCHPGSELTDLRDLVRSVDGGSVPVPAAHLVANRVLPLLHVVHRGIVAHRFDQLGDIRSEVPLEIGPLRVGVLQDVVQDGGRHDTVGIAGELQLRRHLRRM